MRFLEGDLVGILSRSSQIPDFVEVLARRSCGYPSEILCCRGVCEEILRTSCWNPLKDICAKILEGACMKVCKGSLQEVLVQRSCQIPSIRSFFDDCVKFSLRSWLEVLEFLFTDVFLNAVRAFLPGMIVSIFCLKR